ncbi:MAG TPA: DUF2946 domain-containing protein [Paraburkholderia sp.]|jgi:hypothetical protein
MSSHAHRRLTAWLGMIALWLIVLVPVASQLIVAARSAEPVAATCTAAAPSVQTLGLHSHSHGHDHGMIACGYCDLLAAHATLPTVAPPLPVLVMLVTIVALLVLSMRFTPLGAFPSGRPRAPPAFSRS